MQKGYLRADTFSVGHILGTFSQKSVHMFHTNHGHFQVRFKRHKHNLVKRQKECQCCGLKGVKFCLEIDSQKMAHMNFYGINANGHEILLTIDHITPKSRGGKNFDENLQLLCYSCNQQKRDDMLTLEQLRKRCLRNTHIMWHDNPVQYMRQLHCQAQSPISIPILKLNIRYQHFQLFHHNSQSIVIAQNFETKKYDVALISTMVDNLYDFMWLINTSVKPRMKYGAESWRDALKMVS